MFGTRWYELGIGWHGFGSGWLGFELGDWRRPQLICGHLSSIMFQHGGWVRPTVKIQKWIARKLEKMHKLKRKGRRQVISFILIPTVYTYLY